MSKEDEESKVTIEDFVSQHKFAAFCRTYVPADAEGPGVEVFNDMRLRKYFQAFPRNIGDPLNVYLSWLEKNHYEMRTSVQGEPAIFVRLKVQAHDPGLMDAMFGDRSLAAHNDDVNENDN